MKFNHYNGSESYHISQLPKTLKTYNCKLKF